MRTIRILTKTKHDALVLAGVVIGFIAITLDYVTRSTWAFPLLTMGFCCLLFASTFDAERDDAPVGGRSNH